MMQPNISDWERAGSIVAATLLGAVALNRRDRRRAPALLAAGGLFLRGITGYCPVSALSRRDTRHIDSRDALAGSRGIHVRESVTINRPVDEVYRFWRDLSNLPRFMSHLARVEEFDRTRSRWTVRGPAGVNVSWDAHIINEIPNELIGWRSVGDADVISAGSVHFEPTARGTEIWVHLQYEPPAGRLGARFASLFGNDPALQIREDLERLKLHLENPSFDQLHWGVTAHSSSGGQVKPFPEPELGL
jgi:uncharacterized membrane protein